MLDVIQETAEPASPDTICVVFGRKQFNALLYEIQDSRSDAWKVAQIELKGDAVASQKFDRIEFFADTTLGPIVGQHDAKTEDVYVTLRRPTDGIIRTADEILSEMSANSKPN